VDQRKRNTDIRKSRICNEGGIGDLKNRFRVFLGRWSYESKLFAPSFELCAMLCNWRWKQSGDRLVPLHTQLANMDTYNAARFLFSEINNYLHVTGPTAEVATNGDTHHSDSPCSQHPADADAPREPPGHACRRRHV